MALPKQWKPCFLIVLNLGGKEIRLGHCVSLKHLQVFKITWFQVPSWPSSTTGRWQRCSRCSRLDARSWPSCSNIAEFSRQVSQSGNKMFHCFIQGGSLLCVWQKGLKFLNLCIRLTFNRGCFFLNWGFNVNCWWNSGWWCCRSWGF